METSHTPPPWIVYDDNEGDWPPRPLWCVANDAYHNPTEENDGAAFMCTVSCGYKADADLIAAAHDLLELVMLANDGVRGTHTVSWQQKAKAAIAKASPS